MDNKCGVICFQDERSRGEHNLTNISKTHERMQQEQRSKKFYSVVVMKLTNYRICLFVKFHYCIYLPIRQG